MNPEEILISVNEIFKKVFENPSLSIGMQTSAADVAEWDSLNHTALIVAVEKHFGIRFKLKEVLAFQNVGDMVRTIHSRLSV